MLARGHPHRYEGDDFTGTVKVKLGPISLTYKGKGTVSRERDATAHRVVIDASGRTRAATAPPSATITAAPERRRAGQDRGHRWSPT